MKKFLLIGIGLLLVAPIVLLAQEAPTPAQPTGTLTVVVRNLKNNNGQAQVSLYNSQESFASERHQKEAEGTPEATGAFRQVMLAITDQRAEVVFNDIPLGEYAVKVWHDENNNGKVDRNFTGMPKEGIAFSNNARIKFGPPKYDAAKFAFQQTPMTIEITMP